jgi:hypothetical protein
MLAVLRAVSYAQQPEAVAALISNADHHLYMEAAARIRAGGPLYPEWQLTGPYGLDSRPELYPPPTILLFVVPMSYLPDVLWWAIPLAILIGVVAVHRPSLVGWAGILACFAPPWAWDGILAGGLFMWVAAAVALGTIWPAASIAVLMKPSLYPFAIFGVRSKWWWVGLGLAIAVSLAMLPGWVDYVRALSNLTDPSLLYSIHNVPLVLVPLIAWATRTREPRTSVDPRALLGLRHD